MTIEKGWSETYRGCVNAWECDVVAHFTIGYYFVRFADATSAMLESLGLGRGYTKRTGHSLWCRDMDVRYLHELRAGDTFHVETALVAVTPNALRLALRVVNSTTGERVTQLEEDLEHVRDGTRQKTAFPFDMRESLDRQLVSWDGSIRDPRREPSSFEGCGIFARDHVNAWEVDERGELAWSNYVHRISNTGLQIFTAVGMTPAYWREAQVGFSTFELKLHFSEVLRAGDLVAVKAAPVHIGNSSLRYGFCFTNVETGVEILRGGQMGVQLDMNARRPKPFPEEILEKAKSMLIPTQLEDLRRAADPG